MIFFCIFMLWILLACRISWSPLKQTVSRGIRCSLTSRNRSRINCYACRNRRCGAVEGEKTARISFQIRRRFLFSGTQEGISGVIKHRSTEPTLATSSTTRLFSHRYKRKPVSVSLLSIQVKRDVFSHKGCKVFFLLDVSHVVERRSSTAREARERNEPR